MRRAVSNGRYIRVRKRTYAGRQVRQVYGEVYRGKYVSRELGGKCGQIHKGIGVKVETYGYMKGVIWGMTNTGASVVDVTYRQIIREW